MSLKTTTWEQRNNSQIALAKQYAQELNITNPTIVNYGPGGIIPFFFNHLPNGNKEDWNFTQHITRGILKFSESVLRKTNLFTLKSSETKEIVEAFNELHPKNIYVVDKESKVMSAVKDSLKNHPDISIQYYQVDATYATIPGDIVFANNIIERTTDKERTLETITSSVNPQGILATTIPIYSNNFKELSKGIYQKVH